MALSEQRLLYGYHGTRKQSAQTILVEGFHPSRNPYDWLGDGVYFFEDAPLRAWEWARERFGHEAAVVGASVRFQDEMDLLDIGWANDLAQAYSAFVNVMEEIGQPLPHQTSGAHRLDRAVINFAVEQLRSRGISVRMVRGVFIEGQPVFPDSALYERAHVQIAVRDTQMIERCWIMEEPLEDK